jgi:spore coat polysaccharide biosynthesis predicted glycosyltransferase SpsG
VLFRVDAGRREGLSFGHLSRCLLLARAVAERWGATSRFLMAPIPEGLAHARAQGAEAIPWRPGEARRRLAAAGGLVVDLPGGPNPELLAAAGRRGVWTVVVDDTGQPVTRADAVLNPGVLARPESYPPGARLLLGPEYAVLPPGLDPARRAPRRPGAPLRVLVTLGGSDPTGLTLRVLEELAARPWPGAAFTVILGPGFGEKRAGRARALAAFSAAAVELVAAPAELAPYLVAADAAVCAGGQTLYELAAAGPALVALASTAFEARVIRAFAARGLVAAGLEQWRPGAFRQALARALELAGREGEEARRCG